jgi:hypothetical protein
MDVKVELDIFSGRPNPTWDLTADESGELIQLMKDLPEDQVRTGTDDGLGYRGFLVTTEPKAKEIAVERARVVGGSIENLDTRKVYKDVHGLEKWLFQQARKRGYGAFIDSL